MNRIKLLATLFVGIFIGYTVATFSFSNKQNESGLVQEQQLNYSNINEKQPDIAYVNAPNSSKNISSPLADKVIDPSSRVTLAHRPAVGSAKKSMVQKTLTV